jgi:hypothetical protein
MSVTYRSPYDSRLFAQSGPTRDPGPLPVKAGTTGRVPHEAWGTSQSHADRALSMESRLMTV